MSINGLTSTKITRNRRNASVDETLQMPAHIHRNEKHVCIALNTASYMYIIIYTIIYTIIYKIMSSICV